LATRSPAGPIRRPERARWRGLEAAQKPRTCRLCPVSGSGAFWDFSVPYPLSILPSRAITGARFFSLQRRKYCLLYARRLLPAFFAHLVCELLCRSEQDQLADEEHRQKGYDCSKSNPTAATRAGKAWSGFVVIDRFGSDERPFQHHTQELASRTALGHQNDVASDAAGRQPVREDELDANPVRPHPSLNQQTRVEADSMHASRRCDAAGNHALRPRAVASPLVSSPAQQSGGNGTQPQANTQTPVPVAPPTEFSSPPETYQKARCDPQQWFRSITPPHLILSRLPNIDPAMEAEMATKTSVAEG
jgi:hypothetical protein